MRCTRTCRRTFRLSALIALIIFASIYLYSSYSSDNTLSKIGSFNPRDWADAQRLINPKFHKELEIDLSEKDLKADIDSEQENNNNNNKPKTSSHYQDFEDPKNDIDVKIAEQQPKKEETPKYENKDSLVFKTIDPYARASSNYNWNEILTEKSYTETSVEDKKFAIQQMMKFAWDGYKKYAWGWAALDPVRNGKNPGGPFGNTQSGATIIDSLDTLYIMGLKDELNDAIEWLKANFVRNFKSTTAEVSVFEVTIRYIGGFLSGYQLTGDRALLDMAKVTADALTPAFNTPLGLPWSLISPARGGRGHNYNWVPMACGILADVGTLHLEWKTLSRETGDPKYEEMVTRIRDLIQKNPASVDPHLYPHFLNTNTANSCTSKVGLGSFGDSFYEYLIKAYILDSKDTTAKEMYQETAKAIDKRIITKTAQGNYYVKTIADSPSKMEHLACFSGGMFALSSTNSDVFPDQSDRDHWLKMGEELTKSCRLTYSKTSTQIGPDGSIFDGRNDGAVSGSNSLLRPETIESYFYMYRITGEEKYRKWAWDYAVGLQKYTKTDSGYSGLRNVNDNSGSRSNMDGCQQSFFLAETLKYLYLIFAEENTISLDEFVFNTEAHPLKIIK